MQHRHTESKKEETCPEISLAKSFNFLAEMEMQDTVGQKPEGIILLCFLFRIANEKLNFLQVACYSSSLELVVLHC